MKKIAYIILFFQLISTINIIAQIKRDTTINKIEKINTQISTENEKKIEKFNYELELIKNKQENNIVILNALLGFFVLIVSVGFVISINYSSKNENRAKELFEMYKLDKNNQDNRNNELYGMFLDDREKNEQSAIKTTETTIALVNRTLELAVQASERSAKSLQIRLQNILNSIEEESIKLVQNSGAFDDDKNLTLKREIQTEIHRIGNKIEGLENNLVILDQEGSDVEKTIRLTPYATFIKGTDQYLKEQFDDALKTWETLLRTDIQTFEHNKLKSLIYYWIGYLNNNLLNFKEGISNFANAEKLCEDSRKYELQRMQIETRFFANEDSEVISEDLEKLLSKIENDTSISKTMIKNRTSKVLNTLGNVYYSNFKNTSDEIKQKEFLKKSKNIFKTVLNIEDDSLIEISIKEMDKGEKDKQKWVIFGLAETMFHIDQQNKEIAIKLFEKEIISLAEREYENREEKRTKVLAKTCQLICHYRINKEDSDKLDNDRAMIELPLSDLNKRLTIYSQLVRKNVEYEEFKDHLKSIINKEI